MHSRRLIAALTLALVFIQPICAQDAKATKAGAKPAKLTLALFAGGTGDDLMLIRESLGKIAGIKFKTDDIKFGDFRRDGGVFTRFFPIEIPDLGKADVGAIAKTLSALKTSKATAMYLIIRYRPDSTKNEPFRAALARVKGVQPEKSWVGDANLWVSVDGTGDSKLTEIIRALHGAEIKFVDPIAVTTDKP